MIFNLIVTMILSFLKMAENANSGNVGRITGSRAWTAREGFLIFEQAIALGINEMVSERDEKWKKLGLNVYEQLHIVGSRAESANRDTPFQGHDFYNSQRMLGAKPRNSSEKIPLKWWDMNLL